MNEVQQAVFAAEIRESLVNVVDVVWRAKDAGLCLEHTVELVLTSAEGLVQSIVRTAD